MIYVIDVSTIVAVKITRDFNKKLLDYEIIKKSTEQILHQ
jgi:hypothetical protein